MKIRVALVLAALAAPALASGQTLDLGPDVSGYTRFVVYPHPVSYTHLTLPTIYSV